MSPSRYDLHYTCICPFLIMKPFTAKELYSKGDLSLFHTRYAYRFQERKVLSKNEKYLQAKTVFSFTFHLLLKLFCSNYKCKQGELTTVPPLLWLAE